MSFFHCLQIFVMSLFISVRQLLPICHVHIKWARTEWGIFPSALSQTLSLSI